MWFFANSTGSRLQIGQQISLRLHCNSAFNSCLKERFFRQATMHPITAQHMLGSFTKQATCTYIVSYCQPSPCHIFSPLLELYFRSFSLPYSGRAELCSPSQQQMVMEGWWAAARSLPVSLRAASGTATEGMCIRNGLGNSLAAICNQICNSCCIISDL